jgi:hypothetical protein
MGNHVDLVAIPYEEEVLVKIDARREKPRSRHSRNKLSASSGVESRFFTHEPRFATDTVSNGRVGDSMWKRNACVGLYGLQNGMFGGRRRKRRAPTPTWMRRSCDYGTRPAVRAC